MAYDAAGNLAWSANGQALPSKTACNTANVPLAARTTRTYDARNRVASLSFPDGRGDQAWTYTADGLPATIANANDSPVDTVTNSYTYNKRRLLVGELTQFGPFNWVVSHGYNEDAHVESRTHPGKGVRDNYWCKTIEPETGATVMAYDAAGNLAWSANGQALPSKTACNTANVPVAARITRSYDARNRITALSFPDGLGDTTWTYTPDGLPAHIATNNRPGGTTAVNDYAYNKRRLLLSEHSGQAGWYSRKLPRQADTSKVELNGAH